MLINGKEYNCDYISEIRDEKIICEDGRECEYPWQVEKNLYHDCDIAEGYLVDNLKNIFKGF